MGRTFIVRSVSHSLLIFVILLFTSAMASAQDVATAKKGAEISAFGGFTLWNPAIYTGHTTGATVGVDFTKYIGHWPVAPSFEARVTRTNGTIVNESAYLIGGKLQGQIGQRFHPYVDLLWGRGTIHYNNNTVYPGDNTATIDFGAGLDFDINKHWQAKIDWQHQNWAPGSNQKFQPSGFLFGVVYHFPFRPYVSHRDPK